MTLPTACWDARHRWARAVGIACNVKRRFELEIPLLTQPTLDVRHNDADTRFATPGATYVYVPDTDELHEIVGPLPGHRFVATVFGGAGEIRYTFFVDGAHVFFDQLTRPAPAGVDGRWN